MSTTDVQEWLEVDKQLTEELTDEEIIQMVHNPISEEDHSDDESEQPGPCHVSHSEALEAFDVCLRYLEQQTDAQTLYS